MKSKGIVYLFNYVMQEDVSVVAGVAWISCNDLSGHQMKLCLSSRTLVCSQTLLVGRALCT